MSGYSLLDLPMLRNLCVAYRWAIDEANRQKVVEDDAGMLLAYCEVIDELEGHYTRVCEACISLETPRDAEGSLRAMGHGCPAPSPAVGSAPLGSAGIDITHPVHRFLFTPAVQKLPPVLSAAQASKVRSRV